jgi:hypothetical protein
MKSGAALGLGIVIGLGLALVIVVLRPGELGRSFAPIQSYEVLAEGQTLVLSVLAGRLDSIGYIAAEEDASSVHVRVLLLHHTGSSTADLLRLDVYTNIASPLGSRSVVDQGGHGIPRRVR